MMTKQYDVIIIGAGAAGIMCAITAAQCGKQVLLIDHANKMGKKILLSGGGRCNFTNKYVSDKQYLSNNKHFCKSALSRYTCQDFETLVQSFNIPYHEKTLGQLFCDISAKDIIKMFKQLMEDLPITILLKTSVTITKENDLFLLANEANQFETKQLVIATGGVSFPSMGASPFGYKVAEQFGIKVNPIRAGLVPLTLKVDLLNKFKELSGVSTHVVISTVSGPCFEEAMLFTHKGLSGPAILQISSYWQLGEPIWINFYPHKDVIVWLNELKITDKDKTLKSILERDLPKRLVKVLFDHYLENKPLKQYDHKDITKIVNLLTHFEIIPNGTEGYQKAEVTLGGVDVNEISSKTFEAKKVPGLYFIGEVLDVTGWLGGYNFQWAWSSGYCCGLAL